MPKPNPTPTPTPRPAHRPRNPGYTAAVKVQFESQADMDFVLAWLTTSDRGRALKRQAKVEKEWKELSKE